MFDNWLLMQLQKRIDVVHISIGELEIEFHDCGVIYFSSFIFFFFFSFHFLFPCMKIHASRKSFREGKDLALFISHRLLEEPSYGTLYKYNDPVCFESKTKLMFYLYKKERL